MRFIPTRPTLEETVAAHGGLEAYLDSPEQVTLNNGKNYHDIMLLLDVNVTAAARATGRDKKTIYRIKAIREKEAAHGKKN